MTFKYILLIGEPAPHDVPHALSAVKERVCSIPQFLICTFRIRGIALVSAPKCRLECTSPSLGVFVITPNWVGTVVKVLNGI